jgi:hypothetical protein
MTTTDSSGKSQPTGAPDESTRSELNRAAADLEALADAHDDCTRELETVESTVDAVLDDPAVHVLVLDGERKVTGISRGMAEHIGDDRPVLGRRAATLVPPSWTGLDAMLDTLTTADGWREVPVDDGAARLCVRRATDDEQPAVYVIRYEPPDA